VNDAYQIEKSDTEFGFKTGERFQSATDDVLINGCLEGRVLKVLLDDQIVGVLFWQQLSDLSLYFGPFAVAKASQGKGVGKILLNEVERIAKERGLTEIMIKVVNHRTDLIPWYKSLGYKIVSESPWPQSHEYVLTKPSFFYEMKRSLNLTPDPLPASGFSGGCHCRSVRFHATIDPHISCFCHCSICRHLSGTIVVPWVTIPSTHLQITTGKEFLTTYHSSTTFSRQFCSLCGTQLFFSSLPLVGDEVHEIDISYGSIDEADRLRFPPTHHVWFGSKDGLEYSEDSLPRYRERKEHNE
jgi:GNAT superfamily N-acetyltransferase